MSSSALHSPAAERNGPPILAELLRLLPSTGRALEIASGTGQHAAHFAAALPGWRWQPTEHEVATFPSIVAWAREAGLSNVEPPLQLDVTGFPWPVVDPYDLIYCANMIHIAPWAACLALLDGARQHLAARGLLVLYGPYRIGGQHTADSNAAFDADLRSRDARWGVRDLEAVVDEARARQLALRERIPMPANNQLLVFARV
jgi:SAM-dependent methyltransferase